MNCVACGMARFFFFFLSQNLPKNMQLAVHILSFPRKIVKKGCKTTQQHQKGGNFSFPALSLANRHLVFGHKSLHALCIDHSVVLGGTAAVGLENIHLKNLFVDKF